MKRTIQVLFILAFLASCRKSEMKFSCDPVINDFVTKNQTALSTLNIQEFNKYNSHLQRAVFLSFDAQKKRMTWMSKLHFVLDSIPFNAAEKTHINNLIKHIDGQYFSEGRLNASLSARSKFANDWMAYSINELKWSKKFIAFMVYRLYTTPAQLDAELSGLKSIASGASTNIELGNCSCNVTSDFCGNTNCHTGNCKIKDGCGWLWSMPCNGSCSI